MHNYKRVLIALELIPESDELLIQKAQGLVVPGASQPYLAHAVEHMSNYGAAYGVSAGVDVEEALLDEAKKSMAKVATKYNIPEDHQIVKVGPAKFLILEEAEKHHVDLIVVGSHGRHGVRLLLGSTSNAILHGAKCDVLAVRVKE